MVAAESRSRWSRFFALPSRERRLLLEAGWRLACAGAALRIAPTRAVAAALSAASDEATQAVVPGRAGAATADEIARAVVRVAGRTLGPDSCLQRSLALRQMLVRRGIPAVLRIGVRRAGEAVAAHAWIEVGGRALAEPGAISDIFLPLTTRR